MSDRGSNWGAILARIDPSKTRPFLYVELYGISGIFLWLFGNRATWKAECQVLSQVRDDDAKQFKKSVLNECTMVSVAAAIVAEIAITALSLESLSRTHWLAKGLLLLSLTGALMAVFYATTTHKSIGRLLNPEQVRSWIRGGVGSNEPPGHVSPLFTRVRKGSKGPLDVKNVPLLLGAWEPRIIDSALQSHGIQLDRTSCDPQDLAHTHAKMLAMSPLLLRDKCFRPSVASVIMISAPQGLLSASMASLLLGITMYLGFKTKHEHDSLSELRLHPDRYSSLSGLHFDRNVLIVFVIGLVLCILVYSTSRLIRNGHSHSEEKMLETYMGDWARRNTDLISAWGLSVEFDDGSVRKFVQVELDGEDTSSRGQGVPKDQDIHVIIPSNPTLEV